MMDMMEIWEEGTNTVKIERRKPQNEAYRKWTSALGVLEVLSFRTFCCTSLENLNV